ncbi:MAG: hypothetical protein HQL46_16315 [Gammaproteobacteria bacterium]|nr:hypothetical protein [Gammaproteobacteria bacterium]
MDNQKDYILNERLFLLPNKTFILNKNNELEITESKFLSDNSSYTYRIDMFSPKPHYIKNKAIKPLFPALFSFTLFIALMANETHIGAIALMFLLTLYLIARFIKETPNKYIFSNMFTGLPIVELHETDGNKEQVQAFIKEMNVRREALINQEMVMAQSQDNYAEIYTEYLDYLYRSNLITAENYSLEAERLMQFEASMKTIH